MKHDDVKQDKAMLKTMVHKHEKSMHPGKKETPLAKGGKVVRGGGAAVRGVKANGPLA